MRVTKDQSKVPKNDQKNPPIENKDRKNTKPRKKVKKSKDKEPKKTGKDASNKSIADKKTLKEDKKSGKKRKRDDSIEVIPKKVKAKSTEDEANTQTKEILLKSENDIMPSILNKNLDQTTENNVSTNAIDVNKIPDEKQNEEICVRTPEILENQIDLVSSPKNNNSDTLDSKDVYDQKNKINNCEPDDKKEAIECGSVDNQKKVEKKLNKKIESLQGQIKKLKQSLETEKEKAENYRTQYLEKDEKLEALRDLNCQMQQKVLERVDEYAKADINPFACIIKTEATVGDERKSDNTIHCGNDVWIKKNSYCNAVNKAQKSKNSYSTFVKEVSATIVGDEVLEVSNPTGRTCNRTTKAKISQGMQVQEKQKIDGVLMGAIAGIFSFYLSKVKHMDPISASKELKLVGQYVGQKCNDLCRPKTDKKSNNKKTTAKKKEKKKESETEEKDTEESDSEESDSEDNSSNDTSEDSSKNSSTSDEDKFHFFCQYLIFTSYQFLIS
ncbi:hypothetical protein TKK_0015710 [Trichogramma kaykai]